MINSISKYDASVPRMEKWIFRGPADYMFNVTDELGYNFENTSDDLAKLIHNVEYYNNRSAANLIIPGDSRAAFVGEMHDRYKGYLESLKWEKFAPDALIPYGDPQKMAEYIQHRNGETREFISFIGTRTWAELWEILKNKHGDRISFDNFEKSQQVEMANSKLFLEQRFRDKYMVEWWQIRFDTPDWETQLEEKFREYQQQGLDLMIKLDRSAAGLWLKKVRSIKELEETITFLKKLAPNLPDTSNGILYDVLIPVDAFEGSPSCAGYTHPGGRIEFFGNTMQILSSDQNHEGNILFEESGPITTRMQEISTDIISNYRDELWVKWYWGVDFMLLDMEKLGPNQQIVPANCVFDHEGKTYGLVVAEVNYRITGAYGSTLIKNLYENDINGYQVANFGTTSFKTKGRDYPTVQRDVMQALEANEILFNPHSDKYNKWIFPYSIMWWDKKSKVQTVVVEENEERINAVKDRFERSIA